MLVICPVLISSLSPAAVADVPSGDVVTLPEITVTAKKPERVSSLQSEPSTLRLAAPILDTPASIKEVTRELLDKQLVLDPQEAVRNVSGVIRAASFTGLGENYILRGFVQQDVIKDGFRVGAVSNGGINATGLTDMANIDRIDVLKGPTAILYGRGEPGGLVNYITRMPAFANTLDLRQQFGSYGFYRTEIHGNWNAVPKQFAVRLDAAYDQSESFTDFVESQRGFVAPAFRWQLTPDTSISLRTEFTHDERETNPGFPVVNGRVLSGFPYSRYFAEPDVTEFTNDTWRGLLTLEHRWNAQQRTSIQIHGRHAETSGAYFILFNFTGPSFDPLSGDVSRGVSVSDYTDDNFAVRLNHTIDSDLFSHTALAAHNQLLLSFEYEKQINDRLRLLGGHAPLNAFEPRYTGFSPAPLFPIPGFPTSFPEKSDVEANAYSLLLLDRISFSDKLILSFGGRAEWFSAEQSFLYPDTVPLTSSRNSQDPTNFNPMVGLVVKPLPELSLYASYTEATSSFRNIGLATASGEALDPERARQYEGGIKAEFFKGRLALTTAVFQIDKTNVSSPDPANPLFNINAGEERSRGVEFDIYSEPLQGWKFYGNYAYVDARIKNDPLGLNTGNRRYGVPFHSGSVFSTYELQAGPLRGLGVGGGVFMASNVDITNAAVGTLPGYAQVDGLLYYRRGPWGIQFNAKNLLDKEYFFTSGDGATVQPATARTLIGSIQFFF